MISDKGYDIEKEINIPLKRYIPTAIFLVAGTIFSLIVSLVSYNWESENNRLQFESHANLMADALTVNLDNYLGALLFFGDFYNNSEVMTRKEFERFSHGALSRYPAIKAFSWAPRVRGKDRGVFEQAVKKNGIRDYEIKEMTTTGSLVTSMVRDDYFPILYIEPMSENGRALGFDLLSEENRGNALLSAYHYGEPAASAKVTLVEELGRQPAIIVALPIYAKKGLMPNHSVKFFNLKGFLLEVLVIGDVVNSALEAFKSHGLELTIYDKSPDLGDSFICAYPEGAVSDPQADQENKRYTRAYSFAGREWLISIRVGNDSIHDQKVWYSRLLLAASLAFTLLLSLYLHQKMVTSFEDEQRMKKEIRVNEALEMEIALREKEEARLRMTQQNLEREIKERISIERQRDRNILELKQVLTEVRNLKGILPLCSYCKKIRDDKGEWEQVDVYIHKHSQADVSHGICPDCMKKHYPDEFKEIFGNM